MQRKINLKSTVKRKGILLLADSIQQSLEKQHKIKALLRPIYFSILLVSQGQQTLNFTVKCDETHSFFEESGMLSHE